MYLALIKITIFQIILTFFVVFISKKLNFIDKPGKRKIHKHPTPYTGGVLISIVYLFIISSVDFDNHFENLIISYSTLICFLILIDDILPVEPRLKIILQILPIYLIVNEGLFLNDLGEYNFTDIMSLGAFGKVFTIIACLLIINACNYTDGLDGLLSSISISILFFFLFLIYISDYDIKNNFLIYLIIPLLIFTIFNLGIIKHNKIFLGDNGSNLIGFIIALISIYLYNELSIHPSLIIWPLSLLVYEFLSVNILRILKNKRKLFTAGHDHIHFILKQYFKKKYSLLFIFFISIQVISFFGYLVNSFFGNEVSLFLFIVLFFIYLNIRKKIEFK